MNGRLGTDSILVLFFEFYNRSRFNVSNEVDEYDKLYELVAYFHFEMLEKIASLRSVDSLPASEEEIYSNFIYIELVYYFQLLSCLWKIGLRNLFLSRNTKKVFCNYYYSSYEIEERLVEIYYDVLDKNIKDDYRINNIEKLEDPKYQNFIKKCLPLESKGKITINHIPLDKLVLSDS